MYYKEIMKNLREKNNVTQNNLAELLNVKPNLYCMYENEYQIIPLKHLNTICNYFNVSLDYIFGFTKNEEYNSSQKDIDNLLSGKRLKEFRKENNLTQEKLSKILNTARTVLAGYESGRRLIATPFLYTICKKYNISADYLLGKIDYEPKL